MLLFVVVRKTWQHHLNLQLPTFVLLAVVVADGCSREEIATPSKTGGPLPYRSVQKYICAIVQSDGALWRPGGFKNIKQSTIFY